MIRGIPNQFKIATILATAKSNEEEFKDQQTSLESSGPPREGRKINIQAEIREDHLIKEVKRFNHANI